MNISRPFIERPVATGLLMLAVLLAGLLAYHALPVAALPEVDYPTIQVYTRYPGAGPDVTSAIISSPLERQFGQMAGLQHMDATSANGVSTITLQFELSTALDEAEQEVQAAINAANAYLPKDLPYPPVYSKVNPADPPVLTLAMASPRLPLTQVQELAETRVAQKISQMPGVGLVSVSGGQRPAVRVDMNMAALTQLGMSMSQINDAIAAANVNTPKGSIDGHFLSYAISANDQLTQADQFSNLVVAWRNNAAVRLGQIAQVHAGAEDFRQSALKNLTPAVLISIRRQPGANVISTVDHIRATLPQLAIGLPGAVQLDVLNDRTETIRASVFDVQCELLLALLLVVAVIWAFLRSGRATLIPAISVPLSLIGTLGVAYALGFSLNNLTLMALTIAAGFVVDDAIVMIENVSRRIEAGEAPRQAALAGAQQVGFTIVSLSVSLIAVLIPLLFMGDVVGRLFREFALTLSAAIVVSALITLTLTPTLCAYLLKPDQAHTPWPLFSWLDQRYQRGLGWVLAHRGLTLLSVLLTTLATAALLFALPKSFFPTQDTGVLQGVISATPGSSFQHMQQVQQDTTRLLLADAAVAGVHGALGVDQTNSLLSDAPLQIQLKPGHAARSVIPRLQDQVAQSLAGVHLQLRPVQDLTLDTQTGAATYSVGLSSPDARTLALWAPKVLARLQQDSALQHVGSQALQRGPQALLNIDRATASRLGVSMQAVDTALYQAYGQDQISTIYTDVTQYHVVLAADAATADAHTLLNRIYVPGSTGTPVPLAAIATLKLQTAPLAVLRQAQFPYVDFNFDLRPGYALGDAITHIQTIRQQLPASVSLSLQGTADHFDTALAGEALLLLAAVVVVYITLGILYESVVHPLTILSTLPSAALGALLALGLAGKDFDVISLIGIVLLVGIVLKNAIMMIDFAIELERQQQLPALDAIRRACQQRFRPILMTTLASLLGAVPLALGSGMGAELRQPLGIALIGGLLLSQLLTLFSTPVIYLALRPAEAAVARRL